MARSMTRWVLSGCMALAALGTVAVLDVGSPTAEAAPSVSPFAGSWSGTWSIVEIEAVGTFDLTISDAGRISGTAYNATTGRSGATVGHVRADGYLMLIGWAPADAAGVDASSGFPFQGTAEIDSDDNIVASAIRTDSTRRSLVAILVRN